MSYALVVGGTRGIGKVIAERLEGQCDYVRAIGRNDRIPEARLTYLVFCQRYRGDGDTWAGEIETSLTLTRDMIEAAVFDGHGNNSIVILSSIIAHTVADEQPISYHMAKAALEGMVRFYAVKLGPKGIRVNAIAPGVVLKSENREYYAAHPEKVKLFERIRPIKRMGTASDVAGVVAFLCSRDASFITGQTIVVDGGVSLINQEALARSFLEKPL